MMLVSSFWLDVIQQNFQSVFDVMVETVWTVCHTTSSSSSIAISHMTLTLPPSLLQGIWDVVWKLWLVMEVLFYIYFHVVLIPKANQPYREALQMKPTTQSQLSSSSSSSSSTRKTQMKNPYREPYHIHKHLLLRRILYRILNDTVTTATTTTATIQKSDQVESSTTFPYDPIVVQQVMTHFVMSWFHQPPTTTTTTAPVTNSSSSCCSSNQMITTLLPNTLQYDDIRRWNPIESKEQKLLQPQSSNVSSCVLSDPVEDTGTTNTDTTSHSTTANSSSNSNSSCHLSSDGSSNSSIEEEDTGSVSSTEEPTSRSSTYDHHHPATTTTATPSPPPLITEWTIPQISKRQMNDFLAWSMFNQHMNQMSDDDLLELNKCYQELQNVVHLVFHDDDEEEEEEEDDRNVETTNSPMTITPPPSPPKCQPRRLCLEYVNAWHRPLFIYFVVYIIRTVFTRLVLQHWFGFQRIHSTKVPGVTGWYRPSNVSISQSRIPMIFFHGIAPAGVFFYLPMLLFGSDIITRDRSCLLVDNYNIACTLMFDAKSEQEMVWGVQDFIDTYLPNPTTTPIAVCGHSFGSCVISWLFYHGSQQLQKQIQLCVLLDPVTILLSDPNVMNNFLYSHKVLCCIRMFASSELFTEYYLRHHFSWYNSELWLDEVLPSRQSPSTSSSTSSSSLKQESDKILHVIVGLSECDEIVDAPKVKRHIDLFLQKQRMLTSLSKQHELRQSLRTMYWKGAGHANCLQSQSKWRDIQRTMRECEYAIAQQRS